ncbi:MAG: hypothetical protein HKO82_05955 [Acidimicrobiia bacterium]|nr:hypothetical protein [Acidimicrobiia bacterium]NNL13216.1 hypothetical protein [Acidimicrobiia bacterium]
MGRLERRLLSITDQLEDLQEEERLLIEELAYHRSLADDAARDAAVFDDPIERENAALTSGDVKRSERRLQQLTDRRQKLETRRARLLEKLG